MIGALVVTHAMLRRLINCRFIIIIIIKYRIAQKWLSLASQSTWKERKNLNEVQTKNKLMSVINPVQSNDPYRHSGGTISLLRWEGFVEKVGFEPGVKE